MDIFSGYLSDLPRVTPSRTARVSSWDHTGRNQDYWVIGPGETRVIADLEGPGCIRHIWMTQFCRRPIGPSFLDPDLGEQLAPVLEMNNALGLQMEIGDPDFYRKVLVRITWDDQPHPSVLVPLGDFYGIGHSMPATYQSIPFTVSVRPEESFRFGGTAGLNCYLPMPFGHRALVELVNEGDLPYGQYFQIDYELFRDPLPADAGYLHAQWRRENPCDGWGPDLQVNTPEANLPNLTGDGNYVILDVAGEGHYVGCNLSVTHLQGSWWGEGDDMIFVDGETWPPSYHGTGSEDYFGHAWGMQPLSFPMSGSIVHESQAPGFQVSYRFHLADPVRFASSLRVTMEHGHANHLSDEWASTAYWYQLLPSQPVEILPVEERLPIRPATPGPRPPEATVAAATSQLATERRHARSERFDGYLEERQRHYQRRSEQSSQQATENVHHAAEVRRRFESGGLEPSEEEDAR